MKSHDVQEGTISNSRLFHSRERDYLLLLARYVFAKNRFICIEEEISKQKFIKLCSQSIFI